MSQTLKPSQIGAFEAREFLGAETWSKWNLEMEQLLAYRKKLKGKPDEYEKVILELHDALLEFYGSVLFHSSSLARRGRCVCTSCAKKRQLSAEIQ